MHEISYNPQIVMTAVMNWITTSASAMAADPSLAAFITDIWSAVAVPHGWAASPTAASSLLCASFAAFCWLAAQATGAWSWVDRLWSLAPPAYALIFAWYSPTPRVLLMAALACAWGLRLTANFARKDGYSSDFHASEDYRWPVLRRWLAPYGWPAREAFSLFFVAVYQHVLLALIAAPPMALAAAAGAAPLGAADAALASAFLVLLAIESWTDEVQWAFQKAKYALPAARRAAAGGDIARGFCTTGPFAISRHLNFFAEQSMWWVFWGFSVAAGAPAPNWAAVGTLLLTLLFQGSTWMTELLTAEKYPAYARYQQTTSRLLPWFAGPPLGDVVAPPVAAAVASTTAAAGSARKTRGTSKSRGGASKSPATRRRSSSARRA